MDDSLLGLIVVCVAFMAGYIYREIKFIKDWTATGNKLAELDGQLERVNRQLSDAGIKTIKHLRHEVIGGVNYFFTEADGSFAGQGATLEDAANHWTLINGRGAIGIFMHTIINKRYYFVDGACMEYNSED